MNRTAAATAILAALLLAASLCALFIFEGEPAGKATTGTTAYIVESIPANCSFAVGPGYNIISLPCLSTAAPVREVTDGARVIAMYQYVPGDSDPWRVYNPNLPWYVVSDLQYMTRRAGYIVLINDSGNSVNRTIAGLRVGFTDVPIVPGWSLIGYPAFEQRNITDAFGSLNDSIVQVITYNKSTERFVTYPGDLTLLTPGEGYWVESNGSASWRVLP